MEQELDKKDNFDKRQNNRQTEENKPANLIEDVGMTFLYKKTERVTAGLYLVTNLLAASEPLRVRLRECALSVLSDTLAFVEPERTSPHVWAERLAMKVGEIGALLAVARLGSVISEMNAALLSREYDVVAQTSREYAASHAVPFGQVRLPDNFFTIDLPVLKVNPLAPASKILSKYISGASAPDMRATRHKALEEGVPPTNRQSGKVAGKQFDRREQILLLIKKQGRISIKDATEAISGCSEKTLQRELLALVSEGVVTKIGERRWSTYALAAT